MVWIFFLTTWLQACCPIVLCLSNLSKTTSWNQTKIYTVPHLTNLQLIVRSHHEALVRLNLESLFLFLLQCVPTLFSHILCLFLTSTSSFLSFPLSSPLFSFLLLSFFILCLCLSVFLSVCPSLFSLLVFLPPLPHSLPSPPISSNPGKNADFLKPSERIMRSSVTLFQRDVIGKSGKKKNLFSCCWAKSEFLQNAHRNCQRLDECTCFL